MVSRVNYDDVSGNYDRRYDVSPRQKIGAALMKAASQDPGSILEVGCGTGYWLEQLSTARCRVYGLDLSAGMLDEARKRTGNITLMRGEACLLPIETGSMDMVYVVNAIHHFRDPRRFLAEAGRILRDGGVLAIVGSDPHDPRYCWYVYDWFDGVLEHDLRRFPSWIMLSQWLEAAGFDHIERTNVDLIEENFLGNQVFDSPFLEKHAVSQLILLSDLEYQRGLDAMRGAVRQAEKLGNEIRFPVLIPVDMVLARKGSSSKVG